MEFWEIPKEEREQAMSLKGEELRVLVLEGVRTPFWKYLRSRLALTMHTATTHLTRRHLDSLDSLVSMGKWNAVFKTAEELFNIPETIIKSIEIQKQIDEKKKDKSRPDSSTGRATDL